MKTQPAKNLAHIGRAELVSLADCQINDVPAKVDTGADGSAIWASDVSENAGVLSFCLFAPGSVFYTGQQVTTTDYKTRTIKNSFGEKETRYSVKLSISLSGKHYQVNFSLANRSRNQFPILLGKSFLKSRFLVDVSSNYLLSDADRARTNRVLVLASRTDAPVKAFFKQVQAHLDGQLELKLVSYKDLVFYFGKKPKITIGLDGDDLSTFDVIYIKAYKLYPELAAAVARYGEYHSIAVRDEEILQAVAFSKLSETMKLACYQLPVPESIAMSSQLFSGNFALLETKLGLPFVLKDAYSDRGQNNHLVESEATFKKILTDAPAGAYYIAQQYIPNDGFYRVLVLGRSVSMVVYRSHHVHSDPQKAHLNKPRGGANAKLLDAKTTGSAAMSLALKAAEVMQRQVAGVDLIQHQTTKAWYILEVNYNPQMVSGAFTDQKTKAFAKFIEQELDRR